MAGLEAHEFVAPQSVGREEPPGLRAPAVLLGIAVLSWGVSGLAIVLSPRPGDWSPLVRVYFVPVFLLWGYTLGFMRLAWYRPVNRCRRAWAMAATEAAVAVFLLAQGIVGARDSYHWMSSSAAVAELYAPGVVIGSLEACFGLAGLFVLVWLWFAHEAAPNNGIERTPPALD